jgi:hypothetical protein
MRNIAIIILTAISISACNIGAGTLGGFDSRKFETDKKTLVIGIDSLYKLHPEYSTPDKWKDFDNWTERGYDFLEGRILYFASSPEEMYYITILAGDETRVAVRAVHTGTGGWLLEEDFSLTEKERIETRFDFEIISKLEKLTKSKSVRVD